MLRTLALAGVSLLAVSASAQEPPAQECDRLVAAPADGFGRGVEFAEIDGPKAVAACTEAIKQFPSSLRLKAHYARALIKVGEFRQAREQLDDAVEKGNATAQATLGSLYYFGVGIERDLNRARSLFERAARQENAVALTNLGVMHTFGHGVEKDAAKAAPLFERAAKLGHPDALTNLGNLYEQGQGVDRDVRKAAEHYLRAAELGNPKGQLNLAQLYESNGTIVGGTLDGAYVWYGVAARRGAGDVQTVATRGLKRVEPQIKAEDLPGLQNRIATWQPKD